MKRRLPLPIRLIRLRLLPTILQWASLRIPRLTVVKTLLLFIQRVVPQIKQVLKQHPLL